MTYVSRCSKTAYLNELHYSIRVHYFKSNYLSFLITLQERKKKRNKETKKEKKEIKEGKKKINKKIIKNKKKNIEADVCVRCSNYMFVTRHTVRTYQSNIFIQLSGTYFQIKLFV